MNGQHQRHRAKRLQWLTIKSWIGAVAGIIAFFVSTAAYLRSGREDDDLRGLVKQNLLINFAIDRSPKIWIDGDQTLVLTNAGNRSIAVIGAAMHVVQTNDESLETCTKQGGALVTYNFPGTVVNGQSVAVIKLAPDTKYGTVSDTGRISLWIDRQLKVTDRIRLVLCMNLDIVTASSAFTYRDMPLFATTIYLAHETMETGASGKDLAGIIAPITLVKHTHTPIF